MTRKCGRRSAHRQAVRRPGVDPMLGRAFLADEGRPGQIDVVVLSYGLWQRHFGSDSTVIGRSVPLDGRNHLVIG